MRAAAVRAKLGQDLPEGGLRAMGTAVCRAEREFNRRAGFTASDDRLPAFFAAEALTPTGNSWDVPEADLDRVFG